MSTSREFSTTDKRRILAKVDELDSYLNELVENTPTSFNEYKRVKDKRSCERSLHLCLECVIDICRMLISALRLGLPSGEDDVFQKLHQKGILSEELTAVLQDMKGLRNILVHEYSAVDDQLVYKILTTRLNDFRKFKEEILTALRQQ